MKFFTFSLAKNPFYKSKTSLPGADFFNRHMLKSGVYCALDVSVSKLRKGVERYHGDENSFGVVADLSKPFPFRECADLCVSSNTLL